MKKNLSRIICFVLMLSFFSTLSMGAGRAILGEDVSYTIADEVIVDNEVCTLKITKAEVDPIWGFTLKVFCENKTADKTLMFSISDAIVNGYMASPYWAEEVAPGKKSNDKVTFLSADFDEIGITSADEIIFSLKVYDSNDWLADAFVEDTFTIYPTGLTADQIQCPERKTTPEEQILVENDDICFVVLSTEVDDIWGYRLRCYIENKTDKDLMFSWDDVSVNGFMIDPYWAREVSSHARCYNYVSFYPEKLAENDITVVEDIEFSMRVYDSDNWMADDVYKDSLSYKPAN